MSDSVEMLMLSKLPTAPQADLSQHSHSPTYVLPLPHQRAAMEKGFIIGLLRDLLTLAILANVQYGK